MQFTRTEIEDVVIIAGAIEGMRKIIRDRF